MPIELTPEETRVIGCLMEKAVTTPDQYPLTLNALTNACNQKSSREPVMHLETGLVQRTARQLEAKHLLSIREGGRSGTEKYSQRLCNTHLATLKFSEAEYAVITLMLLRGAQTPGELRSRSGRLHTFADNADVAEVLQGLIDREGGAVVARLPKRAGRQDHEYMHLFAGELESAPMETAERAPRAPGQREQIETLERRVSQLEAALVRLGERVGAPVELEDQTAPNEDGEEDRADG